MKLKADARIRAILNEIRCDTLADIGCDHGKVAVGALLENRARKVIAVDISKESLKKCHSLGEKAGVSDRLECRQGDGFAPIKDGEADFAVIAGMGGREIVKIISNSNYTGALLLVAHQDIEELRKFLSGRYDIHKDFAVSCGDRFYSIIIASPGEGYVYADEELYFGRDFPKTEAFAEMLKAEKEKLERIVKIGCLTEGEAVTKLKEANKLCQRYGIL